MGESSCQTNGMQVDALSGEFAAQGNASDQRDAFYHPKARAHLYVPQAMHSAYIFATCTLGKLTACCHASIVLSPNTASFDLSSGGFRRSFGAVAIRPLTPSKIHTVDAPLVTLRLEPTHEYFRAFRALSRPGVLAIDRSRFSSLDVELRAAMRGDLPLETVAPLIDRILAIVAPQLPENPPQDDRMLKVCESIRSHPDISLEEIAAEIGVSYDRASHLFTRAVGLPFRSYRLWYKLRQSGQLLKAGETLTMAAHVAGFADSAHLCRTYQKLFGYPPSYYFDRRLVKIHRIESAPLRRGH